MEVTTQQDQKPKSEFRVRYNSYGSSKKQILQSAQLIFAKQGFNRTTLKDVASHSHANTALIGYHFGNKEGLQQAVIDDLLNRVTDILTYQSNDNGNSQVNVESAINNFISYFEKDDQFFRLLEWALLEEGMQIDLIFSRLVKPLCEHWVAILKNFRSDLTEDELMIKVLYMFCSARQLANYCTVIHEFFGKKMLQKPDQALEKYRNILRHQLLQIAKA